MANRSVAKVGFQVPDEHVHNITGYCAAEMAFEDANKKGELPFDIEIVPIITRKNIEIARREADAFTKLPDAIGVLGDLNSAMAVSTKDIYAKAEFAQLSSEASSPLLTPKGNKNFFRLVANDEVQGRELGKVAAKYLKCRNIAVLSDNSAWGRPIAEIFTAEVKRLGCDVSVEFYFTEKEENLDFDDMIEQTVAAKPDLVYFAVYWNKAHIITHRLRDLGVNAVFLGSDALKPFAFLEVPSLDKVSPYHSLAGVDIRIKKSCEKFFREFALRYPTMLNAPQYAAEAYDIAGVLIEAMKRAGKIDHKQVLHELQNIGTYEGAIGTISFDENGDLVNPEIGLYQCKDGLRNYIGPISSLVE